MELIERLEYIRPDGVRFLLHAPPSRMVMSSEGFGTPPLEYVVDRAPFQNGDTVRSFTAGPRVVQLVVAANFRNRADYWTGRQDWLDALRPNRVTDFGNPGKLRYYLANGQLRQLDVLLESGPGFAPPQGGWREWSFTEVLRFVAHDPLWYNPTQHSYDLTKRTVTSNGDQLRFPLTFSIAFSTTVDSNAFPYLGVWEEYPEIKITGPITNPEIHNYSTNQKIALTTTIPDGMYATIVLRGLKSVKRSDGTNLLNYVTQDSDLSNWSLQPDPVTVGGVNEVIVIGTDTGPNTSVTMSWYDRYIGI